MGELASQVGAGVPDGRADTRRQTCLQPSQRGSRQGVIGLVKILYPEVAHILAAVRTKGRDGKRVPQPGHGMGEKHRRLEFQLEDRGGGATDPVLGGLRDIKQHVFEDAVCSMLELFPALKRLKLMRQWGGTLDIAHDASPIVSTTDIPGLYVSAGWWGGFKAVPAGGYTLAHLIAKNEPHPLIAPFSLDRFKRLDFILEAGTTTAT